MKNKIFSNVQICVCLVCLLNFTFLAHCILSRVIAAAYVSKEQETDCQRPSQGISKINKHNTHIRWSECQLWDKLNWQRKLPLEFPFKPHQAVKLPGCREQSKSEQHVNVLKGVD